MKRVFIIILALISMFSNILSYAQELKYFDLGYSPSLSDIEVEIKEIKVL